MLGRVLTLHFGAASITRMFHSSLNRCDIYDTAIDTLIGNVSGVDLMTRQVCH